MRKIILLALLSCVITSATLASEILRGKEADAAVSGAELVRYKDFSSIPAFIKFRPTERIPFDRWETWMSERFFKSNKSNSFSLIQSERDNLGMVHYRFQQMLDGFPVAFGIWIVHTLNGEVISMNGELFDHEGQFAATISESQALQTALDKMGASSYKWEIPEEEAWLKYEQEDNSATYYPKGELAIVNEDVSLKKVDLKLAWKFNIYAHEPLGRKEIYVDAKLGNVLFQNDLIHHADSNGTANTGYSGQQDIVADYTGTQFRLRETGRGNGVQTYNMNFGTNYGGASDFTDNDNNWNTTSINQYGTDAHWGAEMTYDFYWNHFGRNSIDDNGFTLRSYVHYDNSYSNAFWDGQRMTYGAGNGNNSPFTALDIAGHEVTHGLTSFTADLVYQNEPGALNESFSDIFGASIEFDALGFANGDWLMGEDLGFIIRYMNNPNQLGDPDTYQGTNWYVGPNDNGGVHTNSGVQNFWFYLLTEGGTGTNDLGNPYSVTGIGLDDAAAIAYRNLVTYLTVTSQYEDAQFYSLQSALDLFGPCSEQLTATGNAWHAVGIGSPYLPTVVADFSSNSTGNCYVPLQIEFYNFSSNATSHSWDFGDGGTSNLINPMHTYNNPGTYTVTLQVSSSCGADTTVATDYIVIGPEEPCEVILPEFGTAPMQYSCYGTLYDNGGPAYNYTNDANSYVVIHPTGAGSVTLDFTNFDVEPGSGGTNCNYDFLQVYDGNGLGAPVIGTYCNNNLPPASVTSTSSYITVRFFSDGGVTNPGFRLDWSCNTPTVEPIADFEANIFETCDGEVTFTDLSNNGVTSWYWQFGDGGTDTAQNPTHVYTANGSYTVTLTATNNIGSDSIVKTNYILVNRPDAPTGTDDEVCPGEQASLLVSGTGEHRWYNSQNAVLPLYVGDTFQTPIIQTTTPYFVETVIPGPAQSTGAPGNSIGSGEYFNFLQSLYFDAFAPFILHSVKVYASSSGVRHIVMLDENGNIVNEKNVNIPFGQQTVVLDFEVAPGTDYQLTLGNNSTIELYRNNGGVNYPYEIPGLVSVTRSSANQDPYGYYYFFYDWKIQEYCISERAAIYASVDDCLGVDELMNAKIAIFPNPTRSKTTIQAADGIGEFSVDVYDLTGQLLHRASNHGAQQFEMDFNGLSKGVYLLQVMSEGKLIHDTKLIVQ